MTETEFSSLIDCRFPCTDRAEALRLIELACTISPNAAFMVADELARPPRTSEASGHTRASLLAELESRLNHPLKPILFRIARQLTAGTELSIAEALAAMRQVASYPGQYAALSIAYFAANDTNGQLESVYQEIERGWHQ